MNDPLHTAPGARIIDGKALSDAVRGSLRARIAASGRRVRLDAILVGDDRAAGIYAMNQAKTCEEVGIEYVLHRLPAGATYDDIAGRVLLLNSEDGVRALMLHLPLPAGIDAERIQSLISPEKDVEGVNPANIGNVVYGRRSLVPCTALASLEMIESTGIELRGKRCAVIGASNIWVKPGAVVIDVGINRIDGPDGKKITVGDVDFESVRSVAGWISPVPGGVGPMTVAMLLRNVVEAALR
jgi:methylenetetrahydrofolate dehydrogenase (NADP+)/methenyltetrahydrofolate cyclohydrolase